MVFQVLSTYVFQIGLVIFMIKYSRLATGTENIFGAHENKLVRNLSEFSEREASLTKIRKHLRVPRSVH